MSARAHFLSSRVVRRCTRRGVAEGNAALKAVSLERKPGRNDSRDGQERLTDLLCSLRQWAEENSKNGVSFHEALRSSETHFMVERGKLAENHMDMHLRSMSSGLEGRGPGFPPADQPSHQK